MKYQLVKVLEEPYLDSAGIPTIGKYEDGRPVTLQDVL